ncbi:MAG: hypothetical protein WA939_24785 [Nodosilinea sp.]
MEKIFCRGAMTFARKPTRSAAKEKTKDMSVLLSTHSLGFAALFSRQRSLGQFFLSLLLSALLLGTLLGLPITSQATDTSNVARGASAHVVNADHHAGWSKDTRDSNTVPEPANHQGVVEESQVSGSADELTKLFGFPALREHGNLARADGSLLPSTIYFDGDLESDLLPPQLLKRPPPFN